jgi:hypothetical protein
MHNVCNPVSLREAEHCEQPENRGVDVVLLAAERILLVTLTPGDGVV